MGIKPELSRSNWLRCSDHSATWTKHACHTVWRVNPVTSNSKMYWKWYDKMQQKRLFCIYLKPIDCTAVDKRWKFAKAVAESISDWTHGKYDVQLVTTSLNEHVEQSHRWSVSLLCLVPLPANIGKEYLPLKTINNALHIMHTRPTPILKYENYFQIFLKMTSTLSIRIQYL